MRLHRSTAFVGTAILATGLLLPTAAAAALPARVGPHAVTGYLEGPIDLTPGGPLVPLASLKVGQGQWVAVATLDVTGHYGDASQITCRLKAGADQDRFDFLPDDVFSIAEPIYGGSFPDAHISLVVAHQFGSDGGDIVLSCRGSSEATEHAQRASDIRIVAVKAARLRKVNLADGSYDVLGDTTGPAASTIFHGRRSRPVKIEGGGALTKVAEMQLGAGRWWVHATTMLESREENHPVTVTCQLSRSETPTGSGDADTAGSGMQVSTEPGGRPQITLDAAMTFSASGGKTRMWCSTPDVWDADARSIRITAVKASKLQRLLLPSGQDVTTGYGHPSVVAARRPGQQALPSTAWTTMASMHLKKGRYLVDGKVHVQSDEGQEGKFLVHCRLVTGPYIDGGTVGSNLGSATLPLQFVITVFSDDGGTLKLRCRKLINPPDSDVTIQRIRLTALQLGTYKRKSIEP